MLRGPGYLAPRGDKPLAPSTCCPSVTLAGTIQTFANMIQHFQGLYMGCHDAPKQVQSIMMQSPGGSRFRLVVGGGALKEMASTLHHFDQPWA
jgi:hypothetical protein